MLNFQIYPVEDKNLKQQNLAKPVNLIMKKQKILLPGITAGDQFVTYKNEIKLVKN